MKTYKDKLNPNFVVDAIQYGIEGQAEEFGVTPFPEGKNSNRMCYECGYPYREHGCIMGGRKIICPGDYVVRYSDGMIVRCRRWLFPLKFKSPA